MAGVAGFEPARAGTKIRCLTAWLHPSIIDVNDSLVSFRTGFWFRIPEPISYFSARKAHRCRRLTAWLHPIVRLSCHSSRSNQGYSLPVYAYLPFRLLFSH